jgi:hypothetical protein
MISKITLSKIPITKSKSNQIFINKMQIENNNTLSIIVTYFGGCRKHSFQLFGFRETKNKIILDLEHNTNGDTCKKIIRENIYFDLTPINNEYQKMQDISINLFVLTLANFDIEYRILK